MKRRQWLYVVLLIIIYGVMNGYLVYCGIPLSWLDNVVLLQVISFGIVMLIYFSFKKETSILLEKVSQLLDTMIQKQETQIFDPLQDELPSKLQVQTMRLNEILLSQRDEVIEEKEAIQELLGDIAHQLKTPFTNVKLYTELLEDVTQGPEEYSMFYGGLTGEVDKLEFLIEALIKMSRLEGGVIKLKPEQNSIQDTCLVAIRHTYMKAKQRGITLSFEECAEIKSMHDPKWTAEAIGNIIDNAIKYSPEETEIKLSIIPYELFIRIDIVDQGMGIKEENYTKVFRRFFRGEDVEGSEGVGIGLYLSRKIIQDQGGYIKLKSTVGEGSIFSIFLPKNL